MTKRHGAQMLIERDVVDGELAAYGQVTLFVSQVLFLHSAWCNAVANVTC